METLLKKYNKRPVTGDVYTLSNLKVIVDDLLCDYLYAAGFRRVYFYENIRIALGMLSMVVAAVTTYASLYYPFKQTECLLKYLVCGYFSLTVLGFIISQVEGRRVIYEGFHVVTRVDDSQNYILLIYFKGKVVPQKYSKSIFELFYNDGKLDHLLLIKELGGIFKKEKEE